MVPEPGESNHERKHKDSKSMVMEIILDMETHSLMFTRAEIIEHAKEHGIPKAEAESVIDDLIYDNYLHEVQGTNLLARTVWRDYSPAFEEFPEY